MANKNKFLPYVIFGVPILIGGFFLFKYLKSKKEEKVESGIEPETPKDKTITTTPTGGSTFTQQDKLPLKKGSSGDFVKAIQRALKITADGKFGNQTEMAVRNYQKTKNLQVDGIVGKNTWKSLFNADFPSTGVNAPVNPSGTPIKGVGKTSPLISGGGGKTGYLIKDI
jgi:peptidoglycan hydrolase-like protein with peptidoglycan-binding domain